MEIVNGYPCYDCADVASAKRGVDPAKAEDSVGAASAAREPAVLLSGALAGLEQSGSGQPPVQALGGSVDVRV